MEPHPMTVAQLIDILKTLPQDAEVIRGDTEEYQTIHEVRLITPEEILID
jgi:hypothetical protein